MRATPRVGVRTDVYLLNVKNIDGTSVLQDGTYDE